MPKKQSAKKRTQVKDLPKKEKKLSTGDMKKVKGGLVPVYMPIQGVDGEAQPKKRG